MAIFPNTLKNDINAFTQIFNKKDKKLGKRLYIYLPTFSNFLIEKIFPNINPQIIKDTTSIPNEYLNNINKDNFLLEVNLDDERIENTPQYTISKKIDISNMQRLQTALQDGLTEEINVFNNLKYKGELWKYFNPFTGFGGIDTFYYLFLERNAKVIGLLESLFLTTKSIPNKGITADRNLLLYGGDWENDEVHFLEQTNSSVEYTNEETSTLKDYLKYPRTKNASSIKPVDRSAIVSIILLFKYINILQKKSDQKYKETLPTFTGLLNEIVKSQISNVSLEEIIKNPLVSEEQKIQRILDLFLKNGLFYKDEYAQLVPGLNQNPTTVKELVEKYQWNYSEGTSGINQLSSKSKKTEEIFLDEQNIPNGFVAVESQGRLYLPNTQDANKLYSLLKLEGRSELFGSEESIILTQYPIKSHTNVSNKFIDIFGNNSRNKTYMDGKIVDYQTYFKRFNNSHGIKTFGILDELKKDIELLFSIELNPQNITTNENVKKAYTEAFQDLYIKYINTTSPPTFETVFNEIGLYFNNISILLLNFNKINIDSTELLNSITVFKTKLAEYKLDLDDTTNSNEINNELLESAVININTSIKNYNSLITDYNKSITDIQENIRKLNFEFTNEAFSFIVQNSIFYILYKFSLPIITKINSSITETKLEKLITSIEIIFKSNKNKKDKEIYITSATKQLNGLKSEDGTAGIIIENEQKINNAKSIITEIDNLSKLNNMYNTYKNNTTYKKITDLFIKISNRQKNISNGDETDKVYIDYKDCITIESFSNKIKSNPSSTNIFFIITDEGKKSKFICKKEIVKIISNVSRSLNYFQSLQKPEENKVLEKLDNSYLMHTTDFSYVTQQDWLQNPLTTNSDSIVKETSILNNIEPFKSLVYNTFEQKSGKITFDDSQEYFKTLGLSNEDSYATIPDKIGTTIFNLSNTSIDEFKTIFNNMLIDKLDIDIEKITLSELETIVNTKSAIITEIEENVIRHLVFGSYHWYTVTLLGENLKKYNQLQTNFINKWNQIGFHSVLGFGDVKNQIEMFKETKTKPILDQDIDLLDYNNDLIEEDDLVGKKTNREKLDPAIITNNRRNRNFFKRLIVPLMGKTNTNTPFYYKFKFNTTESLVEFKNSLPVFIDEFREKDGSGPFNNLVNNQKTKPKEEQKITTAIIDFVYSKLKIFGEQDKVIFDKANNNVSVDDISEEEYDTTLDTLKATTRVNFKKLKKALDGAIVPVHFGLSPYLNTVDLTSSDSSALASTSVPATPVVTPPISNLVTQKNELTDNLQKLEQTKLIVPDTEKPKVDILIKTVTKKIESKTKEIQYQLDFPEAFEYQFPVSDLFKINRKPNPIITNTTKPVVVQDPNIISKILDFININYTIDVNK